MFEDLGKTISNIADKDPLVIALVILLLVVIVIWQAARNSGNNDSYDHKEKASLIGFAQETLTEQREARKQHEVHQTERIQSQRETTNAVYMLGTKLKDFNVSLGETLDLSHRETINRLGGIESIILEVKESLKTYPENEKKLNKIIEILEQMKESENVA